MTLSPEQKQIILDDMFSEHQIDPFTFYCSITGAPIGTMSESSISLTWETINQDDSNENISDELWARTISSMRPSPVWNYIKFETINSLRINSPKDVCAYLLAKYYQPRDKAYSSVTRTFEQKIFDGMNRIKLYQTIQSAEFSPTQMERFLGALLLLDANFSIQNLSLPFPESPFDLDLSSLETITESLENSYKGFVDKKALLERQAKLSTSDLGSGGNHVTKHAAKSAILATYESQSKKLERQAKAHRAFEIQEMLSELMNVPAEFRKTNRESIPVKKFSLRLGQVSPTIIVTPAKEPSDA